MDRLVAGTAMIGFASEHVVAETQTRSIFQIEFDSGTDSGVDSDVAVPLMLPGVAGLLFEDGEGRLEHHVVIDKVGEAKHPKVAHSKAEVDANDEQHVVSVSLILD